MVSSPMLFIFIFFFASLNDGVVVILQLLILLKASPTFFCYEKKGVLQLSLQLSFWIAMTIYNSLYFYIHECYWTSWMNCKACNSPYIQSHSSATHYNLVPILSQQLLFNYHATILWLQLWYHVDVIFHPFIKI
jgi:hypothetical protein